MDFGGRLLQGQRQTVGTDALHFQPPLPFPVVDLLEPLAAKMAEEPFKLLIMDSIAANMRVDYSGSMYTHH